jgi:TetR/AcrR family transcriptional regulator, regulator of autoinduction and epiphytic fitness
VASTSASDPAPVADGRSLRRERNRDAVVEALLAIYREGNLAPSADTIAARAGISVRSLFRYFEDLEALVRTAVASQQRHLAPLFALDAPVELPFEERLARFLAARVRLLEGIGEVGRVSRSMAGLQPRVREGLTVVRAALRDQLTTAFAPELAALPDDQRLAATAAGDIVSSWESYDLLRNDQRLSKAKAAEVMRAALVALLRADESGGTPV